MSNTASLKKEYAERIAPALKSQFQYSSSMQIPVLKKIVINQGLGMAVADKKIIEVAINEMTTITGQKAVATPLTIWLALRGSTPKRTSISREASNLV